MEAVRWYSRGYLPHFDAGRAPQFVTFRLADSLPQQKLMEWRDELKSLPATDAKTEERKRIERWLDQGHGSACLGQPSVASLVQNSLLFFDGERYALHGWCVMPNHVHVLLTPTEGHRLGKILHSIKSYTAHEVQKLLGATGDFWQTESFDRFVRNEKHFWAALLYIHENPVKAKLCREPEEWPWSSARLQSG